MRKTSFLLVLLATACGGGGAILGSGGADDGNGASPPPPGGERRASSSGGATNVGSSPEGGADADAPRPYVPYDVNHVLSTGQSNAVALDSHPIISTTQPYGNVMFDTGIIPATNCDQDGCTQYPTPASLVPLVEGDTFFYPTETMSAGLANETTKLAKSIFNMPTHDMLITMHARSGNNYMCLRKGGCSWWADKNYVKPFDDGMMEVKDGMRLAKAAGKSYVVRAVTAVHGEHDHYAWAGGYWYFPMPRTDGSGIVADYSEALEEWQRDYQSSVQAITGQTERVPLFISQYSHWNDVPHDVIAYQQLAAMRRNPLVVMVGPTYQLPYSDVCLHFLNDGERALGEYFAKAYAKEIFEGRHWMPLHPTNVTRAGNVITVKYYVPVPPLVVDTDRVKETLNKGFEYTDDSGAPPAIASVELAGPDSVKITLASAPVGANPRIRYAYTFSGCENGHTTARGNIRDSDTTPSQYGYDLFNWSVHFDEGVP